MHRIGRWGRRLGLKNSASPTVKQWTFVCNFGSFRTRKIQYRSTFTWAARYAKQKNSSASFLFWLSALLKEKANHDVIKVQPLKPEELWKLKHPSDSKLRSLPAAQDKKPLTKLTFDHQIVDKFVDKVSLSISPAQQPGQFYWVGPKKLSWVGVGFGFCNK